MVIESLIDDHALELNAAPFCSMLKYRSTGADKAYPRPGDPPT
jgi:hypothetical protein